METKGKKGSEKAQTRQPSQPIYEDFHPSVEWTQDPANHVLRVSLPDFNKEDLRVQVDGSGKLTVRGRKPESNGRYKRLEESYEVPNDSILDKISGRFEDGCLTLIIPKKVVEQEPPQKMISSVDSKEEKAKEKEITSLNKEAEEKEEPQKMIPSIEMNKEEENKVVSHKSLPSNGKKEEEKNEELQNMLPSTEKDKAEKNEEVTHKTTNTYDDEKDEDVYQKKENICEDDDVYKGKKKNKRVFWKKREEERRVDYGLDNLLETINENKMIIVVAVAAFSIGFYVSHKLKSSGR